MDGVWSGSGKRVRVPSKTCAPARRNKSCRCAACFVVRVGVQSSCSCSCSASASACLSNSKIPNLTPCHLISEVQLVVQTGRFGSVRSWSNLTGLRVGTVHSPSWFIRKRSRRIKFRKIQSVPKPAISVMQTDRFGPVQSVFL
jgi:hypothetical protein